VNSKQKYKLSVIIITAISLFILLTFLRVVISGETLEAHTRDVVAGVMTAMIAIVSMIIGSNDKKE
jgi:hypothetical protein